MRVELKVDPAGALEYSLLSSGMRCVIGRYDIGLPSAKAAMSPARSSAYLIAGLHLIKFLFAHSLHYRTKGGEHKPLQ